MRSNAVGGGGGNCTLSLAWEGHSYDASTHFVFTGMGEGHRQHAYMCEILIDRQFFAHFVRIQVTELMEGSLEDENS